MASIFISYRRIDSQDVSGRIYDRLVTEFSASEVFKDVNNILLGLPFANYIKEALSDCDVVLAVIGPSWATIRNKDGSLRLDDPGDLVRAEIETALSLGIPIIPLLVSNAKMIDVTNLPKTIHNLCALQGQHVRPDPDFHRDMDRLVSQLRVLLGKPSHTDGNDSSLNTEFVKLLRNRPDASDVLSFLQSRQVIVQRAFAADRSTSVVWACSFAGHRLDFCVGKLSPTTGRREWHIALLGAISGDILASIKSHLETAESFREWIVANQFSARESLPDIRSDFQCTVIAGRRTELSQYVLQAIQNTNDEIPGVHVRTYDWLLDVAASL